MGDWRLYFLHRDRIEKVTPADVQRVAAKYLLASNRTLGYFIPVRNAGARRRCRMTPDVQALVKDYKGRPPVASVPEFDYSFANVESKLDAVARCRAASRSRCCPSRRATRS